MGIFNRRSDDPASHGVHNSGVMNSGSMGNVQNQPGAVGSHQRQFNVADLEAAVAKWPQLMEDLGQAFTDEQDQVTDPEMCRSLLAVLREQDLSRAEDQQMARSLLGRLSDRCGGAPGISTLIASGMSLLSVAMG
jgi:hypothetical protein